MFIQYLFLLFSIANLFAQELPLTSTELDKQEVKNKNWKSKINKEIRDSFYDPTFDYSRFVGRITDRDTTNNVVKIFSENSNVKFLRSGDRLDFQVLSSKDDNYCTGYVRSSERQYFVIYIKNVYACWKSKEGFFRRGTILKFNSSILVSRVKDASVHRLIILKKREDFFKQLNSVNHFLWTYEQQKIQLALDYDKKILELERAKERAMESFLSKKEDNIKLQSELSYRIDLFDKNLDDSRVEKFELFADRWGADQDLDLPVGVKPQKRIILR